MPELPEVETVRVGLSTLLPGHKITDVKHDWGKSFPNAAADVKQFLVGAKVTAIRRRAKVLLIDLDSNYTLVIHLKMTGQLVYVRKPEQRAKSREQRAEIRFGAGHPSESLVGHLPDKSTRVTFDLQDTSGSHLDAEKGSQEERANRTKGTVSERQTPADIAMRQDAASVASSAGQQGKQVRTARLFFNDQRRFGWVRLMPTPEVENLDFFKKVGPEPLSDDFTAENFIERFRRRQNALIKAALLDQTVIAGVGNIYADESLWGAQIHPSTRVRRLSDEQLKLLFKELQFVLRLAIEKGGSTDKHYVNAEGKRGSYLSFARVFRRENQPCPRCATIIEKSRVAGRGTHTCPQCQILTS